MRLGGGTRSTKRLPDKLRTDLAQDRLWHLDRSSPTRNAVTYALAEAYEDRLRAAADLLGRARAARPQGVAERLSEALLTERARRLGGNRIRW